MVSSRSLIAARFTAGAESALLGGWGMVLSLKFRTTFVVAFHTSSQEAPGNNDRATQSEVPGSLFPLVLLAGRFPGEQVGCRLKHRMWDPSRVWGGWEQRSRGARGILSLGNRQEVWRGGALQKIDGRALMPPKYSCSAWEGR